MSKQFWAILLVIAAVFIGVVAFTGKDKTATTSASPTNHVTGNTASSVKLVEYGDYQCPVCGLYDPTVKQVVEKYKDQIAFQFRNLPIPSLHPNAFAAARAAEAADAQGKFWEMHDKLYENQTAWSSGSSPTKQFDSYAKAIGLDMTKYHKDFASSKVNNAINADLAAFEKTGDDMATPTFYLNGKKVDLSKLVDETNQPTVENFSKLIDAALAAKKQS